MFSYKFISWTALLINITYKDISVLRNSNDMEDNKETMKVKSFETYQSVV